MATASKVEIPSSDHMVRERMLAGNTLEMILDQVEQMRGVFGGSAQYQYAARQSKLRPPYAAPSSPAMDGELEYLLFMIGCNDEELGNAMTAFFNSSMIERVSADFSSKTFTMFGHDDSMVQESDHRAGAWTVLIRNQS